MLVVGLCWRSSSLSKLTSVVMGPGSRFACPGRRRRFFRPPSLLHLREAVVQRVAGAADGADRVLLAGGVEQLAQPADVDVDGALIDIDVAAPDAVEQLLAGKHPARMLEEKFKQTILGRAEIDRATGAHHAALLAVEFDVAIGEHGGEPL